MSASLLILDSIDFPNPMRGELRGNKIYVVSLSNNLEKKIVLEQLRSKMDNNEYIWINVPELINKKAMECRDIYLDWVDSSIERNPKLGKLYEVKGIPFSTWWVSLFFEKNSVKSQSFNNLVTMLSFLDMISELKISNVVLFFKTQPEWMPVFEKNVSIHYNFVFIKKFVEKEKKRFESYGLKGIKRILLLLLNLYLFIKKWVKIKIHFMKKGVSKKLSQNHSVLVVTMYPYLDKSALNKGIYENTFYKSLQKSFEQYDDSLGWLAMLVQNEEYSFDESLNAAALLKKRYTFDLLEEWIGLKEIVLAFAYLLRMQFRIKKIKFQFYRSNEFPWREKNYETGELFFRDVSASAYGFLFFQSILYYLVFKKLTDISNWKRVFYRCEMQAWERALCSSFRKAEKIAIQSTIVPLLLTNYFQGKCLINATNNCPKPDLIGCVGKTTKKLFLDNGWKENQLFILGGFRFDHFQKENNELISWNERKKEIIVALTILVHEAEALMDMIHKAFAHQDVVVKVKPHPFMDESQKIKEIINSTPLFELVKFPLEKLCQTVRCMVVTESSSCFFALNAGCPVVVPRLAGYLDLNPMTGLSDIQEYADSVEELREKVLKIMECKINPLDQEKADRFMADYLDIVEDPMEYHRRIEEAINHRRH